MKTIIENKTLDEERALYNLDDIEVINCNFTGPQDGESAIKECSNVVVKNTTFNLRYPLWCVKNANCSNITMTENARSAVWYSSNFKITDSTLNGVKIFRMCKDVTVSNCTINSIEYGWGCDGFVMDNCEITSEYPFLNAKNVKVSNCTFNTKYPFQQSENVVIENVTIDAKDAFWDSKNITCKNCTLIGDFLAWYSDNLTLINCTIISSQPLCYATNLKVIDCVMEQCDLAFEYSDVQATINGKIKSIKNPSSGTIIVDSVEKLITTGGVKSCNAIIKERNGK